MCFRSSNTVYVAYFDFTKLLYQYCTKHKTFLGLKPDSYELQINIILKLPNFSLNIILYYTNKSLNTFFLYIGNQKTIINEKKGKVQVVHDDEQQENIEQTAQQKEKLGN